MRCFAWHGNPPNRTPNGSRKMNERNWRPKKRCAAAFFCFPFLAGEAAFILIRVGWVSIAYGRGSPSVTFSGRRQLPHIQDLLYALREATF